MTLSQHILVVLQRIEPHGLTESTLRDELRVRLGSRPGETSVQDSLHALCTKGYVAKQTDDLTDDVRYVVTKEGKTK